MDSYGCYPVLMDELWNISRVAQYLGVSERTVYNKVRSGDLPAAKVGRLWRVSASDLGAWLAQRVASGRAASAGFARGPYPHARVDEPLAVAGAAPIPPRTELERLLEGVEDQVVRRMRFVGLLTEGVRSLGWSAPVIVGGYAVRHYTAGDYPTVDIDLAGASDPVAQVLAVWGFEREGRHWYDEPLNLVVEVSGGQLDAAQLEHVAGVRSAGVTAFVLGIEDIIIDRLAACVLWKDDESYRWAKTLLLGASDMDSEYLERRAAEEHVLDRLRELRGEER